MYWELFLGPATYIDRKFDPEQLDCIMDSIHYTVQYVGDCKHNNNRITFVLYSVQYCRATPYFSESDFYINDNRKMCRNIMPR